MNIKSMNINATVYKNVLESVLKPWIDKNYAHTFYMKQDSVPGKKAVMKKSLFLKKILHIFANFGQCQPPILLQLWRKWDPSMPDLSVQSEGPQSHHHEDLSQEVWLLHHVQLQHLLSHYWGYGCSWGLKISNIRVKYGIIQPKKKIKFIDIT